MKLLLTSAGVSTPSIRKALDDLNENTPANSKVGFIPTPALVEPGNKDWFINQCNQLQDTGYQWIDYVDISSDYVDWKIRLEECDIIYLSGGSTFFFLQQIRKSKFDEWVHENLENKVFVGASAGSIVMTPTIELVSFEDFDDNSIVGIDDLSALNLVDFEVYVHSNHPGQLDIAKRYEKKCKNNLYILEDTQAIKVMDKSIEVV